MPYKHSAGPRSTIDHKHDQGYHAEKHDDYPEEVKLPEVGGDVYNGVSVQARGDTHSISIRMHSPIPAQHRVGVCARTNSIRHFFDSFLVQPEPNMVRLWILSERSCTMGTNADPTEVRVADAVIIHPFHGSVTGKNLSTCNTCLLQQVHRGTL